MPTMTYTPLATVTLGSSASSVTFSSIPATYRDLIIVSNTDNTVQADYHLRLNGDTGSNYNRVVAQGDGSATFSSTQTNTTFIRMSGSGDLMTNFSNNAIIQIMDYSATDKHTTVLVRNGTATRGVEMVAGRYASTLAITSVLLFPSTGSFDIGSTFNLFGVIA